MGRFSSLSIQGTQVKLLEFNTRKVNITVHLSICAWYFVYLLSNIYIHGVFSPLFLKQIDYSTYLLIMAISNLDLFRPLLNICVYWIKSIIYTMYTIMFEIFSRVIAYKKKSNMAVLSFQIENSVPLNQADFQKGILKKTFMSRLINGVSNT